MGRPLWRILVRGRCAFLSVNLFQPQVTTAIILIVCDAMSIARQLPLHLHSCVKGVAIW